MIIGYLDPWGTVWALGPSGFTLSFDKTCVPLAFRVEVLMGSCQNYGPSWGTLNGCHIILRQKRDHNFDNHPYGAGAFSIHSYRQHLAPVRRPHTPNSFF